MEKFGRFRELVSIGVHAAKLLFRRTGLDSKKEYVIDFLAGHG